MDERFLCMRGSCWLQAGVWDSLDFRSLACFCSISISQSSFVLLLVAASVRVYFVFVRMFEHTCYSSQVNWLARIGEIDLSDSVLFWCVLC